MYLLRHTFCVVAVAALSVVCTQAQQQETSKEVKVDVKKITAQAQNTPQFNVQNMVDKRWRPKAWLEIDVEFEAKKATADTTVGIDSLEFRYFVGLNKVDKATGKHVVLTATINYVNIAEKESQRALAFVAPASLSKILEKTTFVNADIKAVGVEVYKGAAVAGFSSTTSNRWWANMDQFSVVDGALLPKKSTPFAPLWGDYDVEVAK